MNDHITIETPDFHRNLFLELYNLQKQGVACDVTIVAENGEFSAHRIILICASKFFRRKLLSCVNEKKSRMYVQGVTIADLFNIIQYLYTGRILITKDSLDTTLAVCEMFELNDILDGYKDILSQESAKLKTKKISDTTGNITEIESEVTSSISPNETLHSDKADKIKTGLDEMYKDQVSDGRIVHLPEADEVIMVKSEVNDEIIVHGQSFGEQIVKSEVNDETIVHEQSVTEQSHKATISDTLISKVNNNFQVSGSVKDAVVEHKTAAQRFSFPTEALIGNRSKHLPQESGTATRTRTQLDCSDKPLVVCNASGMKRDSTELSLVKKMQNDKLNVVLGYGSLLIPDMLTENSNVSQLCGLTGGQLFEEEKSSTQGSRDKTHNNVNCGNTRPLKKPFKKTLNVPAPRKILTMPPKYVPVRKYHDIPVTGSITVKTPSVLQHVERTDSETDPNNDVSTAAPAVPVNVFRNISSIKGAILTAPLSIVNQDEQSLSDNSESKTVNSDTCKAKKPRLSVEKSESNTSSQKFVIPPQLMERARQGLTRLMCAGSGNPSLSKDMEKASVDRPKAVVALTRLSDEEVLKWTKGYVNKCSRCNFSSAQMCKLELHKKLKHSSSESNDATELQDINKMDSMSKPFPKSARKVKNRDLMASLQLKMDEKLHDIQTLSKENEGAFGSTLSDFEENLEVSSQSSGEEREEKVCHLKDFDTIEQVVETNQITVKNQNTEMQMSPDTKSESTELCKKGCGKVIIGRRRGRPVKKDLKSSLVLKSCAEQGCARMLNVPPGDYIVPDMDILLQSKCVTFNT